MSRFADYVVAYDITSDKERSRVEKTLKGFGFRIQKSVFECRLTRRSKIELIEALKRLELKSGFVKIYKLEYTLKNMVIGKQPEENKDDDSAFIV